MKKVYETYGELLRKMMYISLESKKEKRGRNG